MDRTSQSAITHAYAQVNGIRLHYAECGQGDDLIVLLHGFPEFWYSWRHQLTFLGERFHVVAPDMRGYNLSDKPTRIADYAIDILVEDVIGLMDHFGVERATVVGHDWGAGVAWAVAQKYPERLAKLAVLQVPPAAIWRANLTLRQFLRSWYMFFFQLPRIPESLIRRNDFVGLDSVFKEKVSKAGSFTDSDIEAYKEALRRPGALTAALNYYRANVLRLMRRSGRSETSGPADESPLARHGRIPVPTLFIYGEQDFAILPTTVRGVGNYIDGPYLEVRIADSGHWVQNEAVDKVNSALSDFLTSQ